MIPLMERQKLIETIDNDVWWPGLWNEFVEAVLDENDPDAVKAINGLALEWDDYTPRTRLQINRVFATVCGWSFDSLMDQCTDE